MAWLEKRGVTFHIDFRFGGQRFKQSLRTKSEGEANEIATRVERRLRLIEQGDLTVPEGIDFATFVLSDGKLTRSVSVQKKLPLDELFRRYDESLPDGSLEANSLYTINIHLNHCQRIFGKRFDASRLTHADLERYVRVRSKEKGRRGNPVSATTIKKELTSFRGVWTWAEQAGLVHAPFPNKGLHYPKTDDKPPFQTWSDIESQIARGGLDDVEQQELWDCLFLTGAEIQDVLEFVQKRSNQSFVYPMMVMAAHTGARRSELVRSHVHDLDFDSNMVWLQERKREKGYPLDTSNP